jgi:hypothetical protein
VTHPVPTGRGRFITIEGPEGAGTTTQASRLQPGLTLLLDLPVEIGLARDPLFLDLPAAPGEPNRQAVRIHP